MRSFIFAAALGLFFSDVSAVALEPVTGLPCEGCEAVFEGLPAQLRSRTRLARPSEPGQPLVLRGAVFGPDGKPRQGVVVYAYQTNAEGRYTFDTIRPAGYPGTDLPQHIHMHVIERGCATYYIDDVLFTDDPRLTPEQIRQHDRKRAGSGVATPVMEKGSWQVKRDIRLGLNIPGYPGCRK